MVRKAGNCLPTEISQVTMYLFRLEFWLLRCRKDSRLRLEDGLDALVIGGAADEDLLGDGILTKRIQTEVRRATTTNTVGGCNGNIVSPHTHISITCAELSIIQALPRILLKVLASVRAQGAVYIGREG